GRAGNPASPLSSLTAQQFGAKNTGPTGGAYRFGSRRPRARGSAPSRSGPAPSASCRTAAKRLARRRADQEEEAHVWGRARCISMERSVTAPSERTSTSQTNAKMELARPVTRVFSNASSAPCDQPNRQRRLTSIGWRDPAKRTSRAQQPLRPAHLSLEIGRAHV